MVLLVFGGAFGIVGTAARHEPDAAIALPIIGVVGAAISLFLLLLSVPSIIAGIGLVNFKPWSRLLAIVVSAFSSAQPPLRNRPWDLWSVGALSQESLPLFASSHGPCPRP